MFSIIAAVGKNKELGKNNELLWHIPEDLKNFKKVTLNKTVIMGRKTFESIGRPLPDRNNIILSKTLNKLKNTNSKWKIYNDFDTLINDFINKDEEIFVIGGAHLYREFLERDLVDKLYISHIDFQDLTADAYFPEIDFEMWKLGKEKEYDGWKFCLYEKN